MRSGQSQPLERQHFHHELHPNRGLPHRPDCRSTLGDTGCRDTGCETRLRDTGCGDTGCGDDTGCQPIPSWVLVAADADGSRLRLGPRKIRLSLPKLPFLPP